MNLRQTSLLRSLFTCSLVAVAAISVTGCGKKDKKSGGSIGAPQAYPPTKTVTPSQLAISSGTASLADDAFASTLSDDIASLSMAASERRVTTPQEPATEAEKNAIVSEVKSRLFSQGPTNLLSLVKSVDQRMAEYDSRVSGMESAPSCLSSTAVDLSSVFSVPGASGASATIPLYGQCRDSSGGLTLIFGKKENDWYLVDGATKDQTGAQDACIAKMVKVSGTADADRVVDGYMVVTYNAQTDNFSGSTTLMHFKADVTAGTLEFTAGGVGIGFNQVHAKSNSTHLYVQYQDRGNNATSPLYHTCFKASDLTLSSSISDCDSLKSSLSLVSLGTKTVGSYTGGGSTYSVPAADANNVDLTGLVTNYCAKMSSAFSAVPAFGLN